MESLPWIIDHIKMTPVMTMIFFACDLLDRYHKPNASNDNNNNKAQE